MRRKRKAAPRRAPRKFSRHAPSFSTRAEETLAESTPDVFQSSTRVEPSAFFHFSALLNHTGRGLREPGEQVGGPAGDDYRRSRAHGLRAGRGVPDAASSAAATPRPSGPLVTAPRKHRDASNASGGVGTIPPACLKTSCQMNLKNLLHLRPQRHLRPLLRPRHQRPHQKPRQRPRQRQRPRPERAGRPGAQWPPISKRRWILWRRRKTKGSGDRQQTRLGRANPGRRRRGDEWIASALS